MKGKIFIVLNLIMFIASAVSARPCFQGFDKTAFYALLKNGDVGEINTQISLIESSTLQEKDAYTGVLLMKKAGIVKKPKDKLAFFKAGRIKFQTAFNADSSNAEYHFLRLAIQEHAPKIVKYSSNINEDSQYVKKHFKNLQLPVQKAIIDYSQTSKTLHPGDF